MLNVSESFAQERARVEQENGTAYPSKAMATAVQAPTYNRSKKFMLKHIRTINEAHVIMLKEQGILPEKEAVVILRALEELDYDKYRNSAYSGKTEDIYFEMETELIEKTDSVAGNMHLARSRNDMCITWVHMMIRDRILSALKELIRLRNTLYKLGEEHKDTLYVIHTHTQQAQPGMMGLYFLAAGDVIGRDIERFMTSYSRVNCSPMGAAAIATSGFPVSRQRVADLAGFDRVIENAYDSIGNMDLFTDTGMAISHTAMDLSRINTDFLLWATEEESMISLADGHISISSIMPQKRNPIALEHLRCALSTVKGIADAMGLAFLKAPYGDIVDHDDAEDIILEAFDRLNENVVLMNSVLATMTVNKELLNERAHESFSVVTEIADEMYRSYGIPFRSGHHFVSYMVKKALKVNYNLKNIDRDFFARCYEEVFHEPFDKDFACIVRAMDPERFVACRNVPGGTGPEAMNAMIGHAKEKIRANLDWYNKAVEQLEEADRKRNRVISAMLS